MLALYRMKIIAPSEIKTDDMGRAVHGLFFRLLSEVDPALADRIHASSHKLFCIWPLDAAAVQIAALEPALQEAMERIAAHRFNDITFAARSVEVKVQSDRSLDPHFVWEGFQGLNSLGNLRIQYLSPTSFRRDGVQELFPEPGLVFRSLYKKAAAICGEWLTQETAPPDEFVPHIRVARYELQTIEAGFGQYKIIGCQGNVIYDCRRLNLPAYRRTVALLAAMAPFIGIGYKTTMGMGRVECELEGGAGELVVKRCSKPAREATACKNNGRVSRP